MEILILEDESAAARRLLKMIEKVVPEANIVGVLESVLDGINWFNTHNMPDLMLMDIQLADGLSFEILRKIDITCPVIFTTSYDSYKSECEKVNCIDYLLKPIKQRILVESMENFKNNYFKVSG
ncbi:response regulator [Fulvivirgaceae bacterium BMA10]|uniref:Response regulator n=1 Tax=Splendidivirga corallicola TaxID=3051826 RepID=A0ABT8KMC4_9BACT|nr:response regulator [Fulvivirgaceae bacterium BMA10]